MSNMSWTCSCDSRPGCPAGVATSGSGRRRTARPARSASRSRGRSVRYSSSLLLVAASRARRCRSRASSSTKSRIDCCCSWRRLEVRSALARASRRRRGARRRAAGWAPGAIGVVGELPGEVVLVGAGVAGVAVARTCGRASQASSSEGNRREVADLLGDRPGRSEMPAWMSAPAVFLQADAGQERAVGPRRGRRRRRGRRWRLCGRARRGPGPGP